MNITGYVTNLEKETINIELKKAFSALKALNHIEEKTRPLKIFGWQFYDDIEEAKNKLNAIAQRLSDKSCVNSKTHREEAE